GKQIATKKTDSRGFFKFDQVPAGNFEVRFPESIDIGGKPWELQAGQEQQVAITLAAGEVKLLNAVSFQPEQYIIQKQVTVDGQPADGILVDVRRPGERLALK